MQINYSAFILPHVGDLYSQCADRFSCGEANNCFAIADGVGNSLFPGEWATILCEDYIKHPDIFSSDSKLVREEELIKQWEQQRDERVSNLNDDERFIYEMGLDKADFAACTFVGLSLDNCGWKCQAIGDSYLFVLDRMYNIITKVASMMGRDFDNYPEYFASKKGNNNGWVKEERGTYDNIAYFVLMTDALSDWFIDATTEDRKDLMNIRTHNEFEHFVNSRRLQTSLKDDDTTMVILQLIDGHDNGILYKRNNVDDINQFINREEAKNESKAESPSAKEDIGTQTYGDDRISQDDIVSKIEKIERFYRDDTKSKLKKNISELIEIIKILLKNGTSN